MSSVPLITVLSCIDLSAAYQAWFDSTYAYSSSRPAGGGGLDRAAGGTTRPACLNPKETSMEQTIGSGGVNTLAISHQNTSRTLHSVHVYIHHELTPEREAALAALVEHAIIDVVKAFAL